MEAHSQMTITLVQEPLHLPIHTHGGHGNTLGAPCPTIIGCENLRGLEHRLIVVHRLSLSHKHHIRQLVSFGQGENLVQYILDTQVTLESLPACHTEAASHAASHLTAHTQSGSLSIGDEYRLHHLSVIGGKHILHCSVHTPLTVCWRNASYPVLFRQACTHVQGDIGHLPYVGHMTLVYPSSHLRGSECRHPHLCSQRPQFVWSHSQ